MLAAVFAVIFGCSLLPGRKPLCLRFAEKVADGILPDGAERYCRRLTWLWFAVLVALFAVNVWLLLCGVWWAGFATFLVVPAILFAERLVVRPRRFRVVFHTSGSTGKSKTIVKTFESLALEVAMYRRRYVEKFGADAMRELTFLGTVHWDHMYGKLWMELLPKALGAKADPDVIRTPEELIAKMNAAKRVVLVTTPSFLDRFAEYAGQYEVPRCVVELLSSGSLLSRQVSDRAEAIFGVAPCQIFGSTETGVVAWRRFGESKEPYDWELLPGVSVSQGRDRRLKVWSPYVFKQGYEMGDAVELSGDRRFFRLLGRVDRLVKINEERVNLAEMEDNVRALGFSDCAIAKMEGRHGDILGCVLVGGERLSPLELRKLMLPVFPKGTVPKRFRYAAQLPRNAQGKVVAEEIVEMLERTTVALRFTGKEHFFQGHFPGMPVLPGVAQVGLAVEHSKKAYGIAGAIKEAKKLKFLHIIEPGHDIALSLSRKGKDEVRYEFREGEALCSSGTLVF